MARNAEVAALLRQLAEAETVREDRFRAAAYHRAARNVEGWAEPVEAMAAADRLRDIPGVGDGIARKIHEYLDTGRMAALERAKASLPRGLADLMSVPGLGPRRAVRLARALEVRSLAGLEKALRAGKVQAIPGFGARSEKAILAALAHREAAARRVPYPWAEGAGLDLAAALRQVAGVRRVELAGSLRRGRDTVGDIDVVAAAPGKAAGRCIAALCGDARVASVIERGTTRARVRLQDGLGVDLRVVAPGSFGAAWLYFTGSKEHNIALRSRAQRRGWSLNEYSLHHAKTRRVLAAGTEKEIYRKLGLPLVPPELREGQGEIEAAEAKALPTLVEEKDMRGDLHVHTSWSDGRAGLDAMADAAAALGHAWLGVSDHAELAVAHGLDAKGFARQRTALARLRRQGTKVELLQGAEVDIRKDGRLGLGAAARARLDYVVGSVHSAFGAPRGKQTARLLRAISGGIDILGHPTGRLLARRPGIEADWAKVFAACAGEGVLVEVDGAPDRLDLCGEQVRLAREAGCVFAVDSDAHDAAQLAQQRHGIVQARRGGLERRHVANAWPARRVLAHLGHSKRR